MTRRELAAALGDAGVEDALCEADRLIGHFCGVSRATLLCEPTRDYNDPRLAEAVKRRRAHEPLAYILGEQDFCRETYFLNRDCLIPRRDTEMLVLEAAKRLPKNGHFADLFCGSGCVGISLCAMRKDAAGVGVDIAPGAVAMAEKNAAHNRVTGMRFLCADIRTSPLGAERFDLITANPPYITDAEMETLDADVRAEPVRALAGGADGLDLFRAMLTACAGNLTADGVILCEIGWRQGADATREAARYGFGCTLLRDLEGRDRVAVLKKAT